MKIVVEKGVLISVEVDYEKDINVKEFAIPDGVVELADECLAHLPMEVETLYIPKTVEKIEEGALFGEAGNWERLKNIIVEDGNKNYRVETGCLIDINANSVILGTENAVIPKWVKKIGFYAFRQRENLTEITIPESVHEIDAQAFASCHNLKRVTIEGKFTRIDNACFIADTEIKEFNIPEDADYEFTNGCLIRKSDNALLMITENGEIPSNVKKAEPFSIIRYFKDIVVPETVVAFAENAYLLLGGGKIIFKKGSPAIEYAKKNELNYEEI